MELPECCTVGPLATMPEHLYAAYNRAGDPATAGLNYQGQPCPTWRELPENVRQKWIAATKAACSIMDGDDGARRNALSFSVALQAAKRGARIARSGWNGKGMWVALTEGRDITRDFGHLRGAAEKLAIADQDADPITIRAHLDMRAADGSLVVGWLASQTDLLAEDWEILGD